MFSLPRPRRRRWISGRRGVQRSVVALGVAVVAAGAAVLLESAQVSAVYQGNGLSGPLYALDAAAQDLALSARRPEVYLQRPGQGEARVEADPRDLISIVAIDERTIGELGAYSGGYPRGYHARVVENLLAGSPRVIAFDVGFFEPTADDAELAAAIRHARDLRTRIVLTAVGLLPQGQLTRGGDGELVFGQALQPLPVLASQADIALANVLPDARGTIRSMPLVARVGDLERPTLGLAGMAAYLRRPSPIDGRPSPDTVRIGGRDVPVDATRSLLINYFGPPSEPNSPASTFSVVSFVDVLRGQADPAVWRDGLVFVGVLGAAGLAEDYWTPVSDEGRKMAGVEIHANVAATLLSTQFLRAAPLLTQAALTLGLAVSIGILAANLGVLAASLACLTLLTIFVASSVGALFAAGVMLPLAHPVLAGVGTFIGVVAYRVAIEQRHARALHRALAAAVPPGVAEQIARNPERIPLGSQRRLLTVMFADLQGFTPFSERADPDQLSRVVGDYLEAMTHAVFAHGGTVDKFIGDAIMALWNAPLDDPDHAQHACATALAMQAALQSLNDRWADQGLPRQRMRVGLNTGPASVGNMGTHQRFAYTAIGDTVNLAARLEPLNGMYGSRICLSEGTLDAAGGSARWLVRYLDRVVVKGRATPVSVYELLGSADDASLAARLRPLLEPYSHAMVLYHAREFEAAERLFRVAMHAVPLRGNGVATDGPSAAYVQRCSSFAAAPPSPEWDGVHVMDHK